MKENELMISVKSLQIGDWVKWEYIRYPDIVVNNGYKTVDAIYSDESVDLIDEDTLYEHVPMDEVKFVGLTTEILEKNGFEYDEFPKFAVNKITEKTNVTFTYHSGSKTIFIGISEPNFNLTSSLVLYVHEMQNILRDARIYKEIII